MYMYIRRMLLYIPVSVPAIYSWFTFLEVSSDSQLLIKWFYSGRYLPMHVTWNGYSWVNLEILVLQMAQLLITKGAHLNAGDRKDRKPLHWAAHMGKSCTMYLYMQFRSAAISWSGLVRVYLSLFQMKIGKYHLLKLIIIFKDLIFSS